MINAPYFRFNLAEIHHLYYGIVVTLLGVWLDAEWLRTLGVVIASDDIGQHICQGSGIYGAGYVSPLAAMWMPLYRTALWRWLVEKFPFLNNN